MLRMLLYTFFVLVLINFPRLDAAGKPPAAKKSGQSSHAKIEKTRDKTWSMAASDEGACFAKWPKQADINIDWFEKGLLNGFYVPLASRMYYYRYANMLSQLPLNSTTDLNKMCLRVTNDAGAVFTALTNAELPSNWKRYSTDEQGGGLLFRLANQVTHFYFRKFFLVHKGFGESLVETCDSNGEKDWVKECKKTEKPERTEARVATGAKKPDENKWMITKTDNKHYAVVVNCFPTEHKKAWHVLAMNPKLQKDEEKAIKKHIKGLGFKKEKSFCPSYLDKACKEPKVEKF